MSCLSSGTFHSIHKNVRLAWSVVRIALRYIFLIICSTCTDTLRANLTVLWSELNGLGETSTADTESSLQGTKYVKE